MRALALAGLAGCSFTLTAQPDPTSDAPPIDAAIDAATDASIDASTDASIDAPDGPLIIEAEDHTTLTMPGAYQWVPATSVPGYSGASYMTLVGGSGGCMQAALLQCGASMIYAVMVPVSGVYYLHLRMHATNGSADSVFASVDDPTAVTTVVVDVMEDGTWRWTRNAQTYALAAGPHTIHLWVRDHGAYVDKLAFLESATPPP